MSGKTVCALDPETGTVLAESRDVAPESMAGALALMELDYPGAHVEVCDDFLEIPEFLRRRP